MTDKPLKVVIKPVTAFRIDTVDGKPLGLFSAGDRWNGMQEFVSKENGDVIILDQYDNRDPLSKLFNDPPEAEEKTVVKITPRLFALTVCPKKNDT